MVEFNNMVAQNNIINAVDTNAEVLRTGDRAFIEAVMYSLL